MTVVAVEGPAAEVEAIVEQFRAGGATPLVLVVWDDASAGAAVRVALQGRSVIVHGVADRVVLDNLYEDLRRLGPVDLRLQSGAARAEPVLTVEERSLLRLLSEGRSLGEAAVELHLSRRTADRRLAHARAMLGVGSTVEALVAHRRSASSWSDR